MNSTSQRLPGTEIPAITGSGMVWCGVAERVIDMCLVQPVQEIEKPSEDLTSVIAAGCRIVVLHGSIVA